MNHLAHENQVQTRIVVDTNVFMGAAWGKAPRGILEVWEQGKVLVCVTEAIEKEYEYILSKTPQSQKVLTQIKTMLPDERLTYRCQTDIRLDLIPEDPSDNKYFECALEAGCKIILSSDGHLKNVSGYHGIQVISAGVFLNRFEESGSRRSMFTKGN